MLKILIAFLIAVEILMIPLIVFCLSGVNILLPGMGLIVSGGLLAVPLIFIEFVLITVTLILIKRLRRRAQNLP